MDSELVTFIREISIGAYKPAEQRKRALELLAAHDAREGERGEYKWQDEEGDLGSARHAAQPQPIVADDERDAERYRLLRSLAQQSDGPFEVLLRTDDCDESIFGERLDALLDSAPQPQEKP